MSDTATILGMSVYAADTQAALHTRLTESTDSAAAQEKDAQGDTVTISEQAQVLASGLAAAQTATSSDAVSAAEETDSAAMSLQDEDDGSDSSDSSSADGIEKQIENLQEQIEEVKDDETLTEEEKNTEVLVLQAQITQLEMQLRNALSEDSAAASEGMTTLTAYGAAG